MRDCEIFIIAISTMILLLTVIGLIAYCKKLQYENNDLKKEIDRLNDVIKNSNQSSYCGFRPHPRPTTIKRNGWPLPPKFSPRPRTQ